VNEFQHFYRPGERTGDALAPCLDCGEAPTAADFGPHHELPAGERLAPQQVLEVLYVAAGSNRTRAEYFPAGALGEEEYEAWLNWPARVKDPEFYVWTVTEVLVGRAYDPAAAVRTYERGRRLSRPVAR
jgi:hypothetical protein